MSYNSSNYGDRCAQCGSYSECSCGSGCNYGYDYSSCTPDYSPISQKNDISPTVGGGEGGAGGFGGSGGSSVATGNSSCVNVHIPKDINPYGGNCCKDGLVKLLTFLKDQSLDLTELEICIYGNTIPQGILTATECSGNPLLSLPTVLDVQNMSLCDDVIKSEVAGSGDTFVSLCAIGLMKFRPITEDMSKELRRTFQYYDNCNKSCDCNSGIGKALCISGFTKSYDVRLNDVFFQPVGQPTILEDLTLVAFDNNMTIFTTATSTYYFAIPTCKISTFVATSIIS